MFRSQVVLLAIVLSSCSNFASVEQLSSTTMTNTAKSDKTASSAPTTSTVARKLQAVYGDYKGTPYVYGGTDRRGFDCSGFINAAYTDAFNVSLPRTTEQIAVAGTPIRRDQLQAGDIIIFKTSVKQLHAGIYTSQGNFIHASTSKGVIQSSLHNDYWRQRYIKARRIL